MFDAFGLQIIAIGALVGVAAALPGAFLVLRRTSMLADAISHSILFGIMVVWILTGRSSGPVQLIGAAGAGILTVVLSEWLTKTGRVRSDAAIGLVFPALFAAGAVLMNVFARDVHIDVHTVLLGEIAFAPLDAVSVFGVFVPQALVVLTIVTLVNAAFVIIFYKELKLTTFDPDLAFALGFPPALLSYALLGLTSVTAVAAFDAVGVVLFVAFVIVPPSAAYLLTDRLWRLLAYSVAIALASSVLGYTAAALLDVSIGGMMALMSGAFLVGAFLLSPSYGVIARIVRRRQQRRAEERRTLLVHLATHENLEDAHTENVVAALGEHLHWPEPKIHAIVSECIAAGTVRREGPRLELTPRGRAAAAAVLDPWRRLPKRKPSSVLSSPRAGADPRSRRGRLSLVPVAFPDPHLPGVFADAGAHVHDPRQDEQEVRQPIEVHADLGIDVFALLRRDHPALGPTPDRPSHM